MLSAWNSNIIASCYMHSLSVTGSICFWCCSSVAILLFFFILFFFCWYECEQNSLQVNVLLHWATLVIPAYESSGFMCVGGGCLRAVSPLVDLRWGARPFLQLLVSSLSPLGITAEAVAALPWGGNGERQTSHTVGSEGPRVVCPLLRLIWMSSWQQ